MGVSFSGKAFPPFADRIYSSGLLLLHRFCHMYTIERTQEDFWEKGEIAESAWIFAIFGKSLGAFRHFPKDNFPTFCTLFPLKGEVIFGKAFTACSSKL